MRFIVNSPNLSREQAEELLRTPRDKVAIDIETISLVNTMPLGVAVAVDCDTGFYFFNPRDEMLREVVKQTPTILFHNAAFDVPLLCELGYEITNYEDTMLLAYSAGILEKSLADLSASILHRDCPSVTSQWKKKDQGNIAIDHVVMGGMCIIHACNTYALWDKLPKTQLYRDIDRPCIDLVMEMERCGLLIDQVMLTEVEQATVVKANQMELELKGELGNINLASPPQVVKALQAKGILGTRKTKGGADSVSEESLRPLNHPVANLLLDWRSKMKTLTTYIPFMRNVDYKGRIYTHFGYTNTGRWSSSRPNLQNLTRDGNFQDE